MAGGTPRHAAITASVARAIGNALRDRPCVVAWRSRTLDPSAATEIALDPIDASLAWDDLYAKLELLG